MTGSEPEQVAYSASGIRFTALAWGRPGDPVAVCLHGFPDTAWTWRHLGPRLAADGFRVIAPFMRGYGPTDLAPDGIYQVGALARDACDAHAAAGGDGRAVLIGHDWGAVAAHAAGAFAPERFSRVVTMSVPPVPVILEPLRDRSQLLGALPLLVRQARRSWYMGFQQLPRVSEAALDRLIPRLWADWSPGYDAREDIARVFAALDTPARRTAALLYYRALAQPRHRSREYASEQRLWAAIPRQPLLCLHGLQDGCMLAGLAERAGTLLSPGGRVEIVERAGHFLTLESPEVVGDLVCDFLAGKT
jgi:pimeloyl-ACP methyl ester carboxylesterase